MFSEFGIGGEFPNNLFDLLDHYSGTRWEKSIKFLWVCVVWTVLWAIWIERNSRTFNKDSLSVSNVWDKILLSVAIWIKNVRDFRNTPLSVLSMGWSFLL